MEVVWGGRVCWVNCNVNEHSGEAHSFICSSTINVSVTEDGAVEATDRWFVWSFVVISLFVLAQAVTAENFFQVKDNERLEEEGGRGL